MSLAVAIADAVVDVINESDLLSGDEEAAREFVPAFDASKGDLNQLRVTVVPVAMGVTALDRTRGRYTPRIDVAVQKRLSADDEDSEELLTLAESIGALFRGKRITGDGGVSAACSEIKHDPFMQPQHWLEKRVFTSVVQLTFVVND